MIDLRQLQALRAVHRTGSVTQAARSLGWSQPTVDYHLRNLDALVGGALLERSTRGSTLTPVGHLVLDRAQEILTLSDRALRDAREFTHMGQTRLRFGTFPTAAAKLLPAVAGQLSDLNIELDAVLEEVAPLVADVNQRELDAALVYTVPGRELPFRSDIATTEVLRDPLLLALPEEHPLAHHTSISLDTLLTLHSERWLLGATQDDPMDAVVVDAFAAAGHTLEVAIRTDDFQVMLGMIAARMVIGLVAKLATGPSHPGVVLRPIEDPSFARSVLLAAPTEGATGQPSTAVRQLAVAIRSAVTALDA
ncbi:LysR family transcriptional regulator [Leucobacter luti]|uniref:Molybdate transport repressor ModE-like protein n=1 Tax=Leucobacter luti TaxID=340320 RepID=A0A4Q7U593_9MICO|nr:LysR family transcriptional regulator [Leucobacter luti]MBL3700943.1 LysR family transcriptional regulator [Leucobacter luti]RZT68836.1 molybdate transport repressor ModE-like protein [Leucobacter luti]